MSEAELPLGIAEFQRVMSPDAEVKAVQVRGNKLIAYFETDTAGIQVRRRFVVVRSDEPIPRGFRYVTTFSYEPSAAMTRHVFVQE
jgi:hypothetical protein